MNKRRRPCVVGLAAALLPLVLTSASTASQTGAVPLAISSHGTIPSGFESTNYPGNFTATSLDHSMLLAMAAFRDCTGNLYGAADLNSSAFIRFQFSRTLEASSATNLRQMIGISSCVPGGCDPQSLLLAFAPSTGVLSLAPAAGGDAIQISLSTGSLNGEGGNDNHKVTPEPGSLALLATGFVFMGGVLRRRSRKRRESAE